MTGAVTIGDFSRITHLSIKTLRRYHEAGLLVPDHVDQWTNYRYYRLEQVPTAQVIHRFRALGMPVREIADLIAVTEPEARARLIAQHLQRLETQLDETHAAVVSLRRLLQPDPAPLEVRLYRTQPMSVAAVHGVVDLPDVLTWYDKAMTEIRNALQAVGGVPTGPAGGLYDNELFTEERGTATVTCPPSTHLVAGLLSLL